MRQHRVGSRGVSRWLTCTICFAVALALLFAAPEAMSQGAGQNAAAPDSGNPFSRWFRTPTAPAAATPATAQPTQRVRKPRASEARKQPQPVAARAAPAVEQRAPQPREQVNKSDWPNAEATAGGAMMTPLTIKTVREQLDPGPETPLVSENELSDIDRAAQPALAAASTSEPVVSTDGSGAIENSAAERAHTFAMGETIKAVMQSVWLEPILLMLAGTLAALAAARVFA